MAISSSSMPRAAKLAAAQQQIKNLETTRSRGLSPDGNKENQAQLKEATQLKEKYQMRVNLSMLLGILIVTAVVVAVARAFAEDNGVFWLFQSPGTARGLFAPVDYTKVLAPFLAISVALERLLETGFNWFEQSSRAVADVLAAPREALDWVGKEYQDAYQATQDAAATIGEDITPESLVLLQQAETRLATAEDRLRSWVNAPEYLAWKKALSIWLGLLAGIIIAVAGDLGILRFIGIPTPRVMDMLLTGLIIGSGPGPMHDLMGILQGGKNALESLGELGKGKEIQVAMADLHKEVQALRKENATLEETVR